MSAWFTPTEMEEREGGSLHFTMGPEMGSDGRVTGWDPPRRIVYEEDWAVVVTGFFSVVGIVIAARQVRSGRPIDLVADRAESRFLLSG